MAESLHEQNWREALKSFPCNIQRYVDEIAGVEWTTQSSTLVLSSSQLRGCLDPIDETVDSHALYILRDSPVKL